MKLEVHADVLVSDLPEIYAFISQDNPQAAERVLMAAQRTFDLITLEPGCGVAYTTRNQNLKSIRMLPVDGFPNYLVFYRVAAESVRILYIIHGARDIPRLFRRVLRT